MTEQQVETLRKMVQNTKRKIEQEGRSHYLVGLYNGLEIAMAMEEGRSGDARLLIP